MAKRVNRNVGMRINNLLSLITIVIMSLIIIIYENYIVKPQIERGSKPECLYTLNVKDEIPHKDLLKESLALLDSGRYRLDGGTLFLEENSLAKDSTIKIKYLDRMFLKSIGVKSVDSAKFLKIKYEVLEYDKSSNRVGSLIVSFRINEKIVYYTKMELKRFDLLDMEDRVDCSIEVLRNYAKL